MDQDFADAVAERDFRQLHKNRTWSKRDQADQNRWEKHDNEKHKAALGLDYAECRVCHPEMYGK